MGKSGTSQNWTQWYLASNSMAMWTKNDNHGWDNKLWLTEILINVRRNALFIKKDCEFFNHVHNHIHKVESCSNRYPILIAYFIWKPQF